MQLLDVQLTGIQRRNRAAFVRRSELPGSVELTARQQVVLRDEHGEFFAGTVVDAVDEDRYLVHLGVRLPEEYAMLRLGRRQPRSPQGHQQMQEVLDLLGDAREALAGTLPVQRRTR
jgi:hypothetical protein